MNGITGGGAIGGSFFSAFCPACVSFVGSIFTSIGLGALVNFRLLLWITVGLLGIGLMGLFLNLKQHKKKYFLLIGLLASVGVYSGRYLAESLPLIYTSSILLIGNAFFDYKALKICKICKNCKKEGFK
ncbi:hypothetical protein HY498_01110 [Candidatus Woesearchaeota archaeon]|nr:hypothetical protein [Candidatus Woesearchaeota archaeon]